MGSVQAWAWLGMVQGWLGEALGVLKTGPQNSHNVIGCL